jgi:hypothetical protein
MPTKMPTETPAPVDTGIVTPHTTVGEDVFVATDLATRWTKADTGTVGAFADKTGAGIESTLTGGSSRVLLTSNFEPFNPLSGGLVEVAGNFRVASGMGFCLGVVASGTDPFASPTNGVYARLSAGGTNVFLCSCVGSSETTDDGGAIVLGVSHSFKLFIQSHRGSGIQGAKLYIDGVLVASFDETASYPTGELKLVVGAKGAGAFNLYSATMDITGGVR